MAENELSPSPSSLDEQETANHGNRSTRPMTTVTTARLRSLLTNSTHQKREQQTDSLRQAIIELINYFNHRNIDAIIRVIRVTFEKLKKRIHSTSAAAKLGKLKELNNCLYAAHLFLFIKENNVEYRYLKFLLN